MEAYQQRVVDEKAELDEKLSKLGDFIAKSPLHEALPQAEKERLSRQWGLMLKYSDVLGERIAAFPQ